MIDEVVFARLKRLEDNQAILIETLGDVIALFADMNVALEKELEAGDDE